MEYYSFDFIGKLPEKQVVNIIHTVDPNYISKGVNFDRYSLAYIAAKTGRLLPDDLIFFEDPRFQSLYLLSNEELFRKAKEIFGSGFSSTSKMDLVRQIMTASHIGNLPPEIFLDIPLYLPSEDRQRMAEAYRETSVGENLAVMSKTKEKLIEDGNIKEIRRRILSGEIKSVTDDMQILAHQTMNNELIDYLNMVKYDEIRRKLESGEIINISENMQLFAAFTNNIPLINYLKAAKFKEIKTNIETNGLPPPNTDNSFGSPYPNIMKNLTTAVKTGNIELIDYLFSIPQFQNSLGEWDLTYLMRDAVKSNNISIIDYLIDKIGIQNVNIEYLIESTNISVPTIDYLFLKGGVKNRDLLIAALRKKKFDIAEYLINKGVNTTFVLGEFIAARKQDEIKFLLQHGIIPNRQDLNMAASTGNNDIYNLLLQYVQSN